MMKRIIKACIVASAFAVLPATASAENTATITHPTGTVLSASHASPMALQATQTAQSILTDASQNTLLACNQRHFHGNLETNSHTAIEWTLTKVEATECGGSLPGPIVITTTEGNGVPWCLRITPTMATDEFQIRGGGCTSEARPLTWVAHTQNVGTCFYQRTAPISGKYTTHPQEAILSFNHQEFIREAGSGFFCPAVGYLDWSFTPTTTSETGNPLYISKG
jgi:hypothetical protein